MKAPSMTCERAALCCAVLRCAVLRCALPRLAALCHALLHYAMPCHTKLAVLRHAEPARQQGQAGGLKRCSCVPMRVHLRGPLSYLGTRFHPTVTASLAQLQQPRPPGAKGGALAPRRPAAHHFWACDVGAQRLCRPARRPFGSQLGGAWHAAPLRVCACVQGAPPGLGRKLLRGGPRPCCDGQPRRNHGPRCGHEALHRCRGSPLSGGGEGAGC